MTEKESSIQITMSSLAVKGTSVSPGKSTKKEDMVLPGHNDGAKTFVQSYLNYNKIFCTYVHLKFFEMILKQGTIHLKRRHFLRGRDQKFAKFADG